ncbi:MAG: patatin-like phospholipase family protein [Ectothiorhodospiraceae bacterium AqS1]|nr:patatin-like phospholipase family protein [Ectothiorhodospiraceae bacterium AqS1]
MLSLDGGGLKGLFTARFLAEWEKHVKRPVTSSFDLIAGTSTGGIIALALGAGFPASQIVEFYTRHGPAIFPASVPKLVKVMRCLRGSRYRPEPLESALDKYFGERLLGESSTRLIIPAYHAERGIHIFKTAHHSRLLIDSNERMAIIARATAAAPTYLPPLEIERGLRLIDGGVWANNPVQIAVNEALGYLNVPQHQIAVVRISTTTEVASPTDYPRTPCLLSPKQVLLFIDLVMRGQSQAASGGVRQILGPERYFEIDPLVPKNAHQLDRLSEDLNGLARTEFRKTVSDLDERGFLHHIAQPFTPIEPTHQPRLR